VFEHTTRHEEVLKAFAILSEGYRRCLYLYYYEGLTYREIAEQLRISVGSVSSNMAQGKRRLKAALGRLPLVAPYGQPAVGQKGKKRVGDHSRGGDDTIFGRPLREVLTVAFIYDQIPKGLPSKMPQPEITAFLDFCRCLLAEVGSSSSLLFEDATAMAGTAAAAGTASTAAAGVASATLNLATKATLATAACLGAVAVCAASIMTLFSFSVQGVAQQSTFEDVTAIKEVSAAVAPFDGELSIFLYGASEGISASMDPSSAELINLGGAFKLDEQVRWSIRDADGRTVSQGEGRVVGSEVFDALMRGAYDLEFRVITERGASATTWCRFNVST
jgi:predicted DNA-binding protein YlxM (UPF0122 family)